MRQAIRDRSAETPSPLILVVPVDRMQLTSRESPIVQPINTIERPILEAA